MKYVALLRGIMPMNPNMKSTKLKEFFESLGFENVQTVIASGNVLFDSPSADITSLEEKIEKELPRRLGFTSSTIIRSQDEIKALIDKNPFKNVKDEKPYYLVVTFFKEPRKEVSTVIDLTKSDGSTMMRMLEKEYGKAITTRTWKTVHRILIKMAS